MFSLSLSNLLFSFGSSGGDLQLDSYILRNYRADKSHRLQLFKSKTGDRKYEHEKRDVNMNNQMKHVLVLSHEQVLVERDLSTNVNSSWRMHILNLQQWRLPDSCQNQCDLNRQVKDKLDNIIFKVI